MLPSFAVAVIKCVMCIILHHYHFYLASCGDSLHYSTHHNWYIVFLKDLIIPGYFFLAVLCLVVFKIIVACRNENTTLWSDIFLWFRFLIVGLCYFLLPLTVGIWRLRLLMSFWINLYFVYNRLHTLVLCGGTLYRETSKCCCQHICSSQLAGKLYCWTLLSRITGNRKTDDDDNNDSYLTEH